MLGNLEILLFDMSSIHKVTHSAVQEVCMERGIDLKIHDISLDEVRDLAIRHDVRCFPKSMIFRDGREIGSSCMIWTKAVDFSEWLDAVLAADQG